MTENYNYTDMSSKWFELANEAYRTYVKTLVWSQERLLETTKTLVGQADTYQHQSQGLVEEYTGQVQRGQQLWQTMWQETMRNSTEMLNQYRAATNTNMADLSQRIDAMQNRMEVAATRQAEGQL